MGRKLNEVIASRSAQRREGVEYLVNLVDKFRYSGKYCRWWIALVPAAEDKLRDLRSTP